MASIIKNKKGFTLVELIVVIAIMAILAAITIPNVNGSIDRMNATSATYETQQAYRLAIASVTELRRSGKSAESITASDIASQVTKKMSNNEIVVIGEAITDSPDNDTITIFVDNKTVTVRFYKKNKAVDDSNYSNIFYSFIIR